jgi:hypothetical protein
MRPWAQGPARAVSLGSPLERRGETFTCKPCEAESRASDQLSQPLIDRSGNLPAAAARRDWAVCKARERPGDEQYSGTRGAEAAMRHLADGWVAGEARVGALPARAAEARAGAVHRGLHSHVWCSRTSRGNGWAARRGLEYWRPTPRRSERGLCIAACTRMSGAPATQQTVRYRRARNRRGECFTLCRSAGVPHAVRRGHAKVAGASVARVRHGRVSGGGAPSAVAPVRSPTVPHQLAS